MKMEQGPLFRAFGFANERYLDFFLTIIPRMVIGMGIAAVIILAGTFGVPYFALLAGSGVAKAKLFSAAFFWIGVIAGLFWLRMLQARVCFDVLKELKTPLFFMPSIKLAFYFFVGDVIVLTLAGIGALFFIIPGIYIQQRFRLTPFLIFDGVHPLLAFDESWKLTRGANFDFIVLTIIVAGFMVAGFILNIVIEVLCLSWFLKIILLLFVLFCSSFLELTFAGFYGLVGGDNRDKKNNYL